MKPSIAPGPGERTGVSCREWYGTNANSPSCFYTESRLEFHELKVGAINASDSFSITRFSWANADGWILRIAAELKEPPRMLACTRLKTASLADASSNGSWLTWSTLDGKQMPFHLTARKYLLKLHPAPVVSKTTGSNCSKPFLVFLGWVRKLVVLSTHRQLTVSSSKSRSSR